MNVFNVCWLSKCFLLIDIVCLKYVIVLFKFLFFIYVVKLRLYILFMCCELIERILFNCLIVLLNILSWYSINLYWNCIFKFLLLFILVVVIKNGKVFLKVFSWLNDILII